jgi:uncharacterized protein YndB with AHSA1/START domain
MSSLSLAPVIAAAVVPLAPAAAFRFFAEEFHAWWPRDYTWARDTLQWIGLEPRVGGRCYELGPHDFHVDWGRVLQWEPGQRLVLAWQVSFRREPEPNPAKASEVEIRFAEQGPSGAQVSLAHRQFERHGPDSRVYRATMASARGWPWILQRYAEAAG